MANKDDAKRPRKGKGQLFFDWSQSGDAVANHPAVPLTEQCSAASTESTPQRPPDSTAIDDTMPPQELRQPTVAVPELPPEDSDAPSFAGYDPGHPWHYLPKGDNAPPVPFDEIPANDEAGRALKSDLPKSAVKRAIEARELLESERRELEQARARYEDIVARGAEALSRYDREIAYRGDDDLARAGSLALLYSQTSWRRGRIAALERYEPRDNSRSR